MVEGMFFFLQLLEVFPLFKFILDAIILVRQDVSQKKCFISFLHSRLLLLREMREISMVFILDGCSFHNAHL